MVCISSAFWIFRRCPSCFGLWFPPQVLGHRNTYLVAIDLPQVSYHMSAQGTESGCLAGVVLYILAVSILCLALGCHSDYHRSPHTCSPPQEPFKLAWSMVGVCKHRTYGCSFSVVGLWYRRLLTDGHRSPGYCPYFKEKDSASYPGFELPLPKVVNHSCCSSLIAGTKAATPPTSILLPAASMNYEHLPSLLSTTCTEILPVSKPPHVVATNHGCCPPPLPGTKSALPPSYAFALPTTLNCGHLLCLYLGSHGEGCEVFWGKGALTGMGLLYSTCLWEGEGTTETFFYSDFPLQVPSR